MQVMSLDSRLTVSPQISLAVLPELAQRGVTLLISNRPDGEDPHQPRAAEIAAASKACGLEFVHIPVVGGAIEDSAALAFADACSTASGAVHAFCRTGTRSATLWALANAESQGVDAVLAATSAAGYDLSAQRVRLTARAAAGPGARAPQTVAEYDVVIVGGGAAGMAAAASLLKRRPALRICISEPADQHYYQPGWTMVGAGVFTQAQTVRDMRGLIPDCITWKRSATRAFDPDRRRITLEDGSELGYRVLIAAPGLSLNWSAIPGLQEALGRNGVTSNYRYDLAPYTWQLVQSIKRGRALFTQPPMPIKCAGAPQKAMYLSADHWLRCGALKDIAVEFHTAGAVLFGVKDYVPALMSYVQKYRAALHFESTLVGIDGPSREATFASKAADGSSITTTRGFDMIHVCPPQGAPAIIKDSALANAAGWIAVNDVTLQHTRYADVFGLGDACSAPNAKTAAAARKQAPVVAENVLAVLDGREPTAAYDGYGSCPLTVERGKIVLAEFGYGGTLLPTLPTWLLDGRKPSRLAWILKSAALPALYWNAMLKGREWLCAPQHRSSQPSNA